MVPYTKKNSIKKKIKKYFGKYSNFNIIFLMPLTTAGLLCL